MRMLILYILLTLVLFPFNSLAGQSIQFKKLDTDHGLSSNQINTIFKDRKGFLWVGTVNGLNRYDGFSTTVFRKSIDFPNSISNNNISRIFEDHLGRLIILTASGIVVYDPEKETFDTDDPLFHKNISIPISDIIEVLVAKNGTLWFFSQDSGFFNYNPTTDSVAVWLDKPEHRKEFGQITAVSADDDGIFWFLGDKFILGKFNPLERKIVSRYEQLASVLKPSEFAHALFADSEKKLWIYSRNEQEGLVCFKPEAKSYTVYSAENVTQNISNNIITSLTESPTGSILVGTDHGGLNVINNLTGKVTVFMNDPGEKSSLAQNSITSLLVDKQEILWVGTYKKGISYYHPELFKFSTFNQHPFRSNWLEYEDVNTFAEDNKGNLWIGSNGGGLIYFDRQKNNFKTYRHDPKNPKSLSSDVIVDLCTDHTGGLWIGTYMGGLNYFDGTGFRRFMNDPSDPYSISHNNVWSVFEDSDKMLWIGTLGGGLEIYDRKTGRFIHHKQGDANSVHSNFVMSISENKDKNIWFATANGIDLYDKKTSRFIPFISNQDTNSLISNSTLDIFCDSRGWVWIATRDGLNMYDPVKQKFHLFTQRNGLPDNNILTILEDLNGDMWLGTSQGLCKLSVSLNKNEQLSISTKIFNDQDGLHGKEFNEHAALKLKNGELVFGGPDGFSIFNPARITSATHPPEVVFTGFGLFNKTVGVGQIVNNRVLLPKALHFVGQIKLKHHEKSFTISFSALNFLNPEKMIYHYTLEGFSSDWATVGTQTRNITYTNLHPGEYVFKVYASTSDNAVQSEPISLKIIIKPPFWKTKWAFSFYLIFTLLLIFYSIQLILNRERNKYLIHQERMQTARVHEMDMLKLKFLTNISHEFRTPLTLIISPLERIIKNSEPGTNRDQLNLIQRNARRLLNLVNQLLDFRRLEVQGLTLLPANGELIGFCKEITDSFSDLSENRNIKLSFLSNIDELHASFDYDKIEKILFNLLSNAFKFTPEGGEIKVGVMLEKVEETGKQVTLSVSDTGIGIPADKQELIFERFVQSLPEGSTVNKGSGIGLSLTKEFTQMHGGQVTVKSNVGEGSCFSVVLPIKTEAETALINNDSAIKETVFSELKADKLPTESPNTKFGKGFKILLVEDNPDIRFYLKDNLKEKYEILEASNGEEAWEIIINVIPDLVVSDVMMPVMDGMELCTKIKSDNRSSHIPVILLTAKSADQYRLEGLEKGADDYITKPFNFEILELRIKNLIEQRKKIRSYFQQDKELQPTDISITSLDEKFLKKIKEITENNLHEPNFSVEKLSLDFGISRAHLYNKLLALTGKTPIEYIRILRIRRAAQLLEKSQLTVMEIAYKVGFNDPRYFTKHFKSEFKMTPSQYAKKYFKSDSSEKEF
jgi:signal transduction histidine kinase/ligand-binding sensor domain-containing protein/DNA-binding response OmpR family regulator